jgi:hypothetical protein
MLRFDQSTNNFPNEDSLSCSVPEHANESALLINCLRGDPYTVPYDVNWHVLLDLTEQHGVLLLVCQSLIETGVDVPVFFSAAAQAHRSDAERLAAELETLLDGFAAQGIEIMPLKGPVLALAIYENATLRRPDDLDLLVRHTDYSRAETLLMEMGFLPTGPKGEHHRRFLRGELMVELHFELASPMYFPVKAGDIWHRSHPCSFRGKPIREMSRHDLVLYLCCHGLKHRFSRVIWILDLAGAMRGWPIQHYEKLMRQAQREDLEPWLLIGCEVVRTIFPQKLPLAMSATIATSPKVAQLARGAAIRLISEDPQINDYRRFYLQAESNTWKRWRYRLRYFVPTRSDHQWAHNHRIHPRLMVILRPLRLLAKHGLRSVWKTLLPPPA